MHRNPSKRYKHPKKYLLRLNEELDLPYEIEQNINGQNFLI